MEEILARMASAGHASRSSTATRSKPATGSAGGFELQSGSHGRDVGKLSGGWKMRVALARILLMRPDVMAARRAEQHLDSKA